LPELTDRAVSWLRFLEHHADADGLVRPESGVNYHTIPQRWVEFEPRTFPWAAESRPHPTTSRKA